MSGLSGQATGTLSSAPLGRRSLLITAAVAALLYLDVSVGGLHFAELTIGLAIAVAAIVLGSLYPAVALCAVLTFVPLQLALLSLLYKHGAPFTIVKDLGYIKDAGTASLLLAMLRGTPGIAHRLRLDFLDWCALVYLAIATTYLLLPAISQSGLGGPPLQIRLNAWRLDCLFVVVMFAARRVRFKGQSLAAARNVVLAIALTMLVFAIWETINETSYNNLLVRTLGLPDYQYYVLKVEPPYGFSYVLHTAIAGVTTTRDGSLFAQPSELGFYMLIPLGIFLERLANHRPSPANVAGIGAAATSLVLCETRSPVLGGLLAIVLAVVLAFRLKAGGRYRLMVLVIAATIVAVPLSAGSVFRGRLQNSVGGTADRDNTLHKSALLHSTEKIINSPLGLGLGSNPTTGARYDTSTLTYSENSFLQVGVELGLAEMLVFIALYLALLNRLQDEARRRGPGASLAGGMWLAGWGLFVAGFFLHVWTLFSVSMSFWGLAGAALSPTGETPPLQPRHLQRQPEDDALLAE